MSKKDNPYSHALSRVFSYTAGLTDINRASTLEGQMEYWYDSKGTEINEQRNFLFLNSLQSGLNHKWIIPYNKNVFTPKERNLIAEFARKVLTKLYDEQENNR